MIAKQYLITGIFMVIGVGMSMLFRMQLARAIIQDIQYFTW
jgi:hypothetical protein